MGVPEDLWKIRMLIVHILDVTTLLTFTWWLLHAKKVTDSAAQCGSSGRSGHFLADPRDREAEGGDTGAVCLHQNEFESCHLYIFASVKELIGVISGKEQVIMHKKK